ncbi:MAG: Spy/CpxP family protein refolding chaperone [Deltaproteobacteria bacterium]|nr:Spy/CpxP family protein refolding chaperone [Deltaproteobacteria bacterium]
MEKTAISLVIILFAIFLFSLTFAADWGRGRGRGGSPGDEGDITTIPDLELADKQVSQIRALREAHLRDVKPFQDRMRAKRKELKSLWLQSTPDQDRIIALKKEIGNLRDLMQGKMNDYRRAIFEILTPEQQSKLETIGRQRGFSPGPRWGKQRLGSP